MYQIQITRKKKEKMVANGEPVEWEDLLEE